MCIRDSIPGYAVEQSDAKQAYTQAWLSGTPTWVRLPKGQWPAHWHGKYTDPVVPLRLALYGHPDSGTDWERHAENHVRSVGFEPVDNWPSCFWHPDHQLFLVIYVDDFKLAGPKHKLKLGWDLIAKGLKIAPPGPLGLYLGCKLEEPSRLLPDTGVRVRVMEYNMEGFLRSCVDRYRDLTGVQYMHGAARRSSRNLLRQTSLMATPIPRVMRRWQQQRKHCRGHHWTSRLSSLMRPRF